jgi:hypothetical protein
VIFRSIPRKCVRQFVRDFHRPSSSLRRSARNLSSCFIARWSSPGRTWVYRSHSRSVIQIRVLISHEEVTLLVVRRPACVPARRVAAFAWCWSA